MKILIFLLLSASLSAQSPDLGIFTNAADIGKPKNAGSSRYDKTTQTYFLKGSGYNIWFNRDEFQYLYKKIAGDFILTANFQLLGDTGNGHRKIGWMIRESADDAAASMNAVVHGDGLVVMQWRPLRGAYMRDPEDEIFFPKKTIYQIIQLERTGKMITMRVANPGEPLQVVGSQEMNFRDSVLAGLYISSHDSNAVEEAKMWNVRIDKPVHDPFLPNPILSKAAAPFTGEMASRVEIIDVASGHRQMIYETDVKLSSPSWLKNNSGVSFTENGASYQLSFTDNSPQKLIEPTKKETAPISARLKETETSPDGKFIYYNDNSTGTMQIWRTKKDGSSKEQLSFDEYHNWFPHISPDGKWIAFLSYPPDISPNAPAPYKKVMLRIMPLQQPGAPKVLAHFYGGSNSFNSNSWSPDSKKISIISNSEMKDTR